MKIVYEKNKKPGAAAIWIRRALIAWLVAAAAEYLLLGAQLRDLTALTGTAAVAPVRMALIAAAVFALLWALSRVLPEQAERWMLVAAFCVLAGLALSASFTWAFLVVCLLIFAVLAFYAARGWSGGNRIPIRRGKESSLALTLTCVAAAAFFLLVSIWTVCRVRSFSAPTYDFGIFAQMFHSMKTTGLPITTVERDGALSHFAVHVSPIYYLLLPFYIVVPTPETLQVLQAAVLASAVIPLWKLAKHHGLRPFTRLALCVLLLVYPAYAGGASYDIHENAFLTPLILWLFYGIDRKNGVLTAISAALVLMVKEDAAVYVAVIALWLVARSLLHREYKWGLGVGAALLLASVAYFLAVTGYLAESGDGVMTYRYKNFMYDGSTSLLSVVKAVLLNPMKAVFECVDAEKLEFIGLTLGALALLPLLTLRYEGLLLLIPYILVNLMSDYQYQHDIFFQYTYGSTACLFYLTLVNLADIRIERHRLVALGSALIISICCFAAQVMPKAVKYPSYCLTYSGYYDSLRQVLDEVPDDASVAATTFYTAYLSQRDELYDIRYASKEHIFSCEYMVLSVTDTGSYKKFAVNGEGGYENLVQEIESRGYVKIAQYEGRLEVYQKQ